jgi:hypothetical protein
MKTLIMLMMLVFAITIQSTIAQVLPTMGKSTKVVKPDKTVKSFSFDTPATPNALDDLQNMHIPTNDNSKVLNSKPIVMPDIPTTKPIINDNNTPTVPTTKQGTYLNPLIIEIK